MGGVALALSDLALPFIFAIDANEPSSETAQSVTFHWAEGRPGARKFSELLGIKPRHRAGTCSGSQWRETALPPKRRSISPSPTPPEVEAGAGSTRCGPHPSSPLMISPRTTKPRSTQAPITPCSSLISRSDAAPAPPFRFARRAGHRGDGFLRVDCRRTPPAAREPGLRLEPRRVTTEAKHRPRPLSVGGRMCVWARSVT